MILNTKQKTAAIGLITLWSVNCYRIAARRPTTMLHIIICPTFFFFLSSENCFPDMKSLWWSLTGYHQTYSTAIYTDTHTHARARAHAHIILYKPHNIYYRRLQSQFPRLFFSCNAGHNKNKENRGSTIIHGVRACAPPTFCTETAAVFNKISNNHNGRTAAGQI
jgi:hypothetical protein